MPPTRLVANTVLCLTGETTETEAGFTVAEPVSLQPC